MGRKSKARLAEEARQRQRDQMLQQQVASGNIAAVFQDVLEHRDKPWALPGRLQALSETVKAAAGQGAAALVDAMFQRMLLTQLTVQLQYEYAAHEWLDSWRRGQPIGDIEHLQHKILPGLDQVYRRGCEIAKAYGSLRHLLDLADRSADEAARQKILKIVKEVDGGEAADQRPPEARTG